MAETLGLSIGVLLRHGTYRIEKILGQGGFGITYLATDLTLDRLVAIKEFFPKDYCDRDEASSHITLGTKNASEFVTKLKAKFLKEARNIARFDNPGIIRIHAAFEENNTAYYVMDYIDGKSLSEIVKRDGPLSERDAIDIIRKVGNALEYIHGQKINHLDVKPANIMVRKSDKAPILIDFGLSKQYDIEGNQTSTTPTGISHGYAPMEQYNDGGVKDFSPQTDLYSLAATLYYILTGTVPPQATKLIEADLQFPESFPVQLIQPIKRAMAPARTKRHTSIKEFIDDISSSEDNDDTVFPATSNLEESTVFPDKVEHKNRAVEIKGNIDNGSSYSEKVAKEESSSKKRFPLKLYALIAIVIMVVGAFFVPRRYYSKIKRKLVQTEVVNDISDSNNQRQTEVTTAPSSVEEMIWQSPLGQAAYTGQVDQNMKPHGEGVAFITSGEYSGNEYIGKFVHGVYEGQTKYTQKNGDTFVGTFKANKYHQGKYTDKQTGDYFEGTFKNGQPDKGSWYNKKGQKL